MITTPVRMNPGTAAAGDAKLCHRGPMPRRSPQLVALAAVLLVIAGCEADDNSRDTPATSASPTCNHAPDTGGGDGGLGAGFDYAESHNDFDTAVPITLCMEVPDGAVRLTGSAPQITVEPETRPSTGSESRFTFVVTVSPGATGRVEVQVEVLNKFGEVGISFHGPEIETDDTGWAFGPWGDSAS